MRQIKLIIASLLIFSPFAANADLLVEDFEGAFPEWESNWLGINSNLQNYYGVGQGRGNNPDGLWISDGVDIGGNAEITFDTVFGSSISSFSIDTTTWISGALFEAFDMNGNTLVSMVISVMFGGYTDPGTYQTISFSSSNGVSGFSITGGGIEGNTSIDNVMVNTNDLVPEPVSVPEPGTLGLLGLGLVGMGLSRRRRKI